MVRNGVGGGECLTSVFWCCLTVLVVLFNVARSIVDLLYRQRAVVLTVGWLVGWYSGVLLLSYCVCVCGMEVV